VREAVGRDIDSRGRWKDVKIGKSLERVTPAIITKGT
jgi:hypothetical protein